jgi:hypothetical protein
LTAGDFNLDGGVDVAIGNYTITGRFDAEPHQFFRTVSLLLNETVQQPGRSAVFRANCGGEAHTDSHGVAFQSDSNFEGGKAIRTGDSISGTDDQTIYQSAREGDFTYTAEVRPGRAYTVKLHFAEIGKKSKKRIFDVTINGQSALRRFDLRSRAPRLTATTVLLREVWPDREGRIRLVFTGVKRKAICSGISVF